jgi:hypothetical protein
VPWAKTTISTCEEAAFTAAVFPKAGAGPWNGLQSGLHEAVARLLPRSGAVVLCRVGGSARKRPSDPKGRGKPRLDGLCRGVR